MLRALTFGVAFAIMLGAVGVLVLGARACDACEPTDFGRYAIVSRIEGQAKYFDLVHDGRVEHTLAGSLDTLCDPPFVARFDVDGDGESDLYFRNCTGHGYLVRRGDALEYVDLGDTSDALGWWARQVLGGGTQLIVLGVALSVVALIALAIAGAMLGPNRVAYDT